jgi:ergothioneine biosynthesis protein EgtB
MIVTTSLKESFRNVRAQSLRICQPLQPEDFVVQPIADVSPPKWHLGHTTWFFESFILSRQPDYQVYNRDYNFLFNSYYESIGARVVRTDRGNITRPGAEEVIAYRKHVDQAMEAFLESDAADEEEVNKLVELGLHHEQQHQELLVTDIKYILGNNPLFPAYQTLISASEPNGIPVRAEQYVEIGEGVYSVGYDGEGFCFDNEQGRHRVYLHPFRTSDRLVTNGEYLAFIQDGGYKHFGHWLQEGWEWVKRESVQSPMYWHQIDGEWHHYTMNGLQKLHWAEPVTHVSFYEAEAFARWKGKRLPTEFEWEVACEQMRKGKAIEENFLESGRLHPTPARPDDDQLLGNVWEWTNSAYLPYPYYRKAEGALGEYNGKFMINQMVLRGGSCATPQSHIRPTYRNFFQTDKRWQFTGIRLAESI